MPLKLVNTFNITDTGGRELNGVAALTTAAVGGKTFLFVGAGDDDGVSVFQMLGNGTLVNLENVDDLDIAIGGGTPLELDDVAGVATVVVGGQTFLLAAGQDDEGFSAFAVLQNGRLLNTDNVDDLEDTDFLIEGANGVASATIGIRTFVFVSGVTDDGVSVFDIDGSGRLSNRDNVADNGSAALKLVGARGLATTQIGGSTFLFVAGIVDDGVSVFSVNSNGTLVNVDNAADTAARELDGVRALTTAKVGNKTFLFTAASADNGVSVFDVATNGDLTNVFNVTDNGVLNLDGAASITTANIAGTTYVFVASFGDDGISAFAVAADGTLINVFNINEDDNPNLELIDANSVTTAVVDGKTFLVVGGRQDDGVSVFRVDTTGVTITGTSGADIIDATHAPPKQLLPSELGDTISALGGNDTVKGLGGNDIISGGAGFDKLYGEGGNDTINGGAGIDKLFGEAGDDTIQIAAKEALTDVFNGGTGTDSVRVLGGGAVTLNRFNATAQSIEKWFGNNKAVLGDNANNVLNFSGLAAKSGIAFINGAAGVDTLTGSKFADVLFGGTGNDVIIGGAGKDVITGDFGADRLRGGLGGDRFDYNSVKDSPVGAQLRDRIFDFNGAQGDKIDLSTIDANVNKAGNQAFNYIAQTQFTTVGQLKFFNKILSGDVNGDGKADFEIFVNTSSLKGDLIL